ncbi:acyltransferase [Clavibacter sp. VKM Ac-2872]|uniref:acyltransferase family protein n=1 Tax=Clavibacter sp. VKM Ac-2872 TaxID=2783812 RepID=UPI00188CB39E|nr:acyltransferase [Clavibacter sp. VKM Ac-2872]MBF4624218.1 acyltransferase [Clavibacter sp. VKM Ac-2872]
MTSPAPHVDPGVPGPETPPRLDRLTSLRFLAALVVFGFHGLVFFDEPTRLALGYLVGQGRSGVTFFFVLSGFLLAWSARPGDRAFPFYRRRFARIYPAYLVSLVFAASLWAILDPAALRRGILTPFLLQAWVPTSQSYFAINVPAWSLSVEAFFYVAFPLVILGLRRLSTRGLWVCLLAMVVVSVALAAVASTRVAPTDLDQDSVWVWLAYYFPPSRLPEFVVGMILGLLCKRGAFPAVDWSAAIVIASAAYLSVGIWPSTYGVAALVVLPFGVLIVAAAQRDLAGAPGLLRGRLPVRLGEESYCFYLLHHIFIVRLAQPGIRDLGLDGPAAFVLALVLTLIASHLVHRFVEVPFERRLRGPRRAPAAATA